MSYGNSCTFVGGEAGIVINVNGTSNNNMVVQDNIFSGQTVMPVIVESVHDGGVTYSYNLFDNCSRSANYVCPDTWISGDMHANSSYEHNLINTPVHFVDANNSDYSLSYPSSAIDAAKPIDSTDEYAGFYFDGDGDNSIRPDIGAVEFFSDEPPSLTPILYSPQPSEMIVEFPVEMTFNTPKGYEESNIQIQVATDGQFLNVVADESVSGQLHYTWPDIPSQGQLGTYYWRVQLRNKGDRPWWGPWGEVRQFTVESSPLPPTPTPTPLPPTPTPTPLPPTPTPNPCVFIPPGLGNPPDVDLVVTNVTLSPANPVVGQQVVVNVTIKNQGQSNMLDGNNSYLDYYVNPSPQPPGLYQVGDIFWGIQSVDFPAGASKTYSGIYNFGSSGDMRIWAQVDTDNTVVEANENNNDYGCKAVTVTGTAFAVDETPTPQLNYNAPRVTPTPSQP